MPLTLSALQRRQLEGSPQADITLVLGLTELRWGELAGLRVGDVMIGTCVAGGTTTTLE